MKKIFCILATALALSACGESWLDVPSKSSILESDYYNSADRLFTGVVAAYDCLNWFDYSGYQYIATNLLSDVMADDIYAGGSNAGDQPKIVNAHFYSLTAVDQSDAIWMVCYSGINRANIVLQKAPTVEMSESLRNRYIAEATILKAYYWNTLWHFWGNIPYYDANVTADEAYSAPQLSADDVYANVIKLIEDAIALNALPMKANVGEEGRVTQAMAYMLYAEMVLYQNDKSRYPTALGYMKEIISSNKYSLMNDFAGIWEESGEWCSESIFEINFESVGGNHNWDYGISTGGNVYPVLIGIPGAKESSGFSDGWGFSPVSPNVYAQYEEGDQRRDGGILNWSDKDNTGGDYTARWQDTGFFLLKYIARVGGNHDRVGDQNLNYGNNRRIYRYAETLLNAAELSLATGSDGSAYLDQVRDRAGVGHVACTAENILNERRLEFVGEGKRYWDLVRTGNAATVLKAANHEYRTTDWTENKKYWPLPQSEIDRNVNTITQNPY